MTRAAAWLARTWHWWLALALLAWLVPALRHDARNRRLQADWDDWRLRARPGYLKRHHLPPETIPAVSPYLEP